MAQDGDTITYTYSGSMVSEDVSSVDEMSIDYIEGADGQVAGGGGGEAGSVSNVVVDVSSHDTIYLWVASRPWGRYNGGTNDYAGGGSTEMSFSNTDSADSSDEPHIAGAGGGQSGGGTYAEDPGGGARGGGWGAEGSGDPSESSGHVASIPEIIDSGSTTDGGGAVDTATDGEIQISYTTHNTPPSFTAGSESPSDGSTDISLDTTLSIDVTDADGDSMDVSFYDASGDSQIGSTQTGISDGGTASVKWSGLDFGTTYSWYAVVNDGSVTTTSSTFSFTTVTGVPQNIQITDDQTEGELTIDWDPVSEAAGYYVYRAQASGASKSDYTQVADVSSPPYTDTGLGDGEQYYYRVSSHD